MGQFRAGTSIYRAGRHRISRSMAARVFALLFSALLAHAAAWAETKPKVLTLGEVPTSAIYTGNSFLTTTTA